MNSLRVLLTIIIVSVVSSSCYRNNIHEKNELGNVFAKHNIDSACFEVYDNTHEQVFVYNTYRSSQQISPASTFKIFNSLVALETNLAPDIDYKIKWDGVKRFIPEWNQDLDMASAFKYSAVPYYQELARKIGRDTMQHYLDTMRYGNMTIGDSVDNFWLDNSLKISPDEQVGFIKKLYFNTLPLSKRSHRLVRSMMLQETNDDYKLSYKTGTSVNANSYVAQLVGYLEKIELQKNVKTNLEETNYRPYFFALSIETKDKNISMGELSKLRVQLLKDLFKELEVIQ